MVKSGLHIMKLVFTQLYPTSCDFLFRRYEYWPSPLFSQTFSIYDIFLWREAGYQTNIRKLVSLYSIVSESRHSRPWKQEPSITTMLCNATMKSRCYRNITTEPRHSIIAVGLKTPVLSEDGFLYRQFSLIDK
jgi:hypothetical protein